LKRGHGAFDDVASNAASIGERDGGEGVEDIVAAYDGNADAGDGLATIGGAKFGGFVMPLDISGEPIAVRRESEGLDRAEGLGGTNLALDEPKQYVPVEPGRGYHFHAYMRTQEITTESGMRFSLADPNHAGAVNLETADFTGSHAWTAVESDFTTGPDTHFLLVRLFRSPSRLFENKLEGTVWVADVSVVPVARPVVPATP
jgi:hypothetical protein